MTLWRSRNDPVWFSSTDHLDSISVKPTMQNWLTIHYLREKKDQSLSLGYCDHHMLILHLKVYPKRIFFSFSGFFFTEFSKSRQNMEDINTCFCSSKSDALLWQILLLKLILMLKNIERNYWIRYCVWGVWWELFSDLSDLMDWHCLIFTFESKKNILLSKQVTKHFKEVGDSEHLKPALSSILYY